MVSLWDPVSAPGPGADGQAPFVVFAGNVGDEDALARTVERLRGSE